MDRDTEQVRIAFVSGNGDHRRWLHIACRQWPTGVYDVLFERVRDDWNSLARSQMRTSVARTIVGLLQADPNVSEILVRPYRIGIYLRRARSADWEELAKRLEGLHRWIQRDGPYFYDQNPFEVAKIGLVPAGEKLSDGSRSYRFDANMATMLIEFDRSNDPWGLVPAHWAGRVDLEAIRLAERLFGCQSLMNFSLAPGRTRVVRNRAYAWDEVDAEVNRAIALIRPPVETTA